MKPVDEGKRVPGRKSGVRSAKKRSLKTASTNSKESIDNDSDGKPGKSKVA